MKRVILRFLKNKAIEIGGFLSYVILIIIGAAIILGGLSYPLGLWCHNSPAIRGFFLIDISHGFFGIVSNGVELLFCIIAGTLSIFGIGLVIFGLYYGTRDWLEENWHRAKREIKDEQELQETNTKR